jgi:hypothetical protein
MEQSKPKSLALPVAALISAVIGYLVAIGAYALLMLVWMEIPRFEHGMTEHWMHVILMITMIGLLLCLIGLILGIVGLIKSVRRPRRLGGIILSGIAMLFGISSIALPIAMQATWALLPNLPHVQYLGR